MKDLPIKDRPREKLIAHGAASLTDAELLAILLRTGTKKESVLQIAERLLYLYRDGGLGALARLEPQEFAQLNGIGVAKAAAIAAALELGKRMSERPPRKKQAILSPKDAADYVMARFRDETREHFLALLLNVKKHVLSLAVISIGTLDASIACPREVFRKAVAVSAASVVLLHNHPSGDPNPSREDISVTKELIKSGEILDINVDDHIIIGDNRYISMREMGLMGS